MLNVFEWVDVFVCLSVWVFVDRLTSFESRSRSSSESRAERGEACLELFVYHEEYVDVELTFYYSYPSWMICFNLHFFCCVEKETAFGSWSRVAANTSLSFLSSLLEISIKLFQNQLLTPSYFYYRRKEPPVSEREPANLTRRAVDADVDPSTSKRAFARPVVILPKRCVDTIGEQKLRDVEPTEPDAWNTWRQCLADSKTDSERVRRLRRFPRTKSIISVRL